LIELTYTGGQRVTLEETLASADAAAGTAALVTALLGYLQGSPYAVPQVETVKVSLSTREQLERADVVDATAERTRVRPGQRLGVRVRLHPFRGDIVSRRLEIQVPPGAAAGRMDLIVADGAAWTAYDLQMRPLHPASFDDELRLVGRLVPSTRLVLALETPAPGIALPGVSTPVPPSVLLALRSGLGAGVEATAHQVVGRVVEEFPFPLSGAQRIPLQVVDDSRTPQLAPEPAPED
jgi:hypothetical protein